MFSSACNKYTCICPQSAWAVQLTLAISKVFVAKWSFSGTQTWQPYSGQQVVPSASILAIVLSLVATSTHSYRDNVFFFIILFTKLGFVLGAVMVQTGRSMGKRAEEGGKADGGMKLVWISRRLYGGGNGCGGTLVGVGMQVRALSLCFPWRAC